jgi:hypothetical protein
MSDIECPIQCINRELICESSPDFLEKHGAFFLTLIGIVSTGLGLVLTYFLRSRCVEIKCWGIFCKRKPLNLDIADVEITSATN